MCLQSLCAEILQDTGSSDTGIFNDQYGIRYQLRNALHYLNLGQLMYVRYDMSGLVFKNTSDLDNFYHRLRHADAWNADKAKLISFIVPGTGFAKSIGKVLIAHELCVPTNIPHWVPHIKIYALSDVGIEAYHQANIWWRQLTLSDKLVKAVLE